MKKLGLISLCSLLSFGAFVTSCGPTNNDKNQDEITVKEKVTFDIKYNEDCGKISLGLGDDHEYHVGDLMALKVEPKVGYRLLSLHVNDEQITPKNGIYKFVVKDKKVEIKGVFELIPTYKEDFVYSYDDVNKTASIQQYTPLHDLVPTPFYIPETTTHNGETYKVTSISGKAFDGSSNGDSFSNSGVTDIVISKNIVKIEEHALNKNPTLKSITVDKDNEVFASRDGVLYDKNLTTILSVPYAVTKGEFIVPDDVKAIGDSAFLNNGYIKKVTMNDNVKTIGKNAFRDMKDVEEVKLSNAIELIPEDAFNGCAELEKVNIPTSTKLIDKRAFRFCVKLRKINIPASVKKIEMEAFYHNEYLSEITFNEGLEEIGVRAFGQSDNFEEVKFPSTLRILEDGAFEDCALLRKVTLNEGLKLLGGSAFAMCINLGNVTIPASVNEIPYNPFFGNVIANIEVAKGNEFFTVQDGVLFDKDITRLISFPYSLIPDSKEYVIPDTVKILDNRSFAYNIYLKKVTIPTSVEEMYIPFYNLLPDPKTNKYELKVEYTGTEEQFNQILHGDDYEWNYLSNFKDDTLYLKDGKTVALKHYTSKE